MQDKDYYEILQVSPKVEPEVIQAAYRRLARKYHPDVNKSPQAAERMKQINEAYEVLRDPAKRAAYDALRRRTGTTEYVAPGYRRGRGEAEAARRPRGRPTTAARTSPPRAMSVFPSLSNLMWPFLALLILLGGGAYVYHNYHRDTSIALVPSDPPQPNAVLTEQDIVGPYVIQIWELKKAQQEYSQEMVATISKDGDILVELQDCWIAIGSETGQDLTNDGDPDAVLSMFSGGAHCCFSTHAYNLGSAITPVFISDWTNCPGGFEDLNHDGVAEFITCDDTFAYAFCCYADSPMPGVVLSYDPAWGYRPDTMSYRTRYESIIARHTEEAKATLNDEELLTLHPDRVQCAVLAPVLDYLYTCQTDLAWLQLQRLYPYDDGHEFRSEIEHRLWSSPLYRCPFAR